MISLQLPLTTCVPAALSWLASPPRKYSINGCSSSTGKRTQILPKSCLDEKSAVQVGAEVMPKHVAIIMDGNGRWAKNRNLPVMDGHKAGCHTLTSLISKCCDLRINTLTIFAFSNDNWKRPQMEVDNLMRAIEYYIQSVVQEHITRYSIRFSAIGNISRLPDYLRSTICSAEEMSEDNKGMHLVLAVSYSGRDDVVQAAKRIATKVESGEILRASDIDETTFQQQLMTNILDFPDPDLLIRTSGELRLSNFLLWQSAYTEFYFSDQLFPDFGEPHLLQALASYQCRHRRYGQRIN